MDPPPPPPRGSPEAAHAAFLASLSPREALR
jgi:hypothetical protein